MPAYYNNGFSIFYIFNNIMKYQDAFHGSNLKHSTVYTKNSNMLWFGYNLIGAKIWFDLYNNNFDSYFLVYTYLQQQIIYLTVGYSHHKMAEII